MPKREVKPRAGRKGKEEQVSLLPEPTPEPVSEMDDLALAVALDLPHPDRDAAHDLDMRVLSGATITLTPLTFTVSDSNKENITMSGNVITFNLSDTDGCKIIPQAAGKTHKNFLILALVSTAALLSAQDAGDALPDGFSEKFRYSKTGLSLVSYDFVLYSEDKAKKIANSLIPGSFAVDAPGEVNASTGRVKLSEADLAQRRYCVVLIKSGMSEADARARSGWTGEIPAPRAKKAAEGTTESASAFDEAAQVDDAPASEENTKADSL